MKKHSRFLALVMAGILSTSCAASLAMASDTQAENIKLYDSSSDMGRDDDMDDELHDEAWFLAHYPQTSKQPNITAIMNDADGVRFETDIADPDLYSSDIGLNVYCSKNGGAYKQLSIFTKKGVPYDVAWGPDDDIHACEFIHRKPNPNGKAWPTDESPAQNGNFYQYKVAVTWKGEEVQVSEPSDKLYYLSYIKIPTAQSLNSGKTLKISWKRNSKADGYKVRYTTSSFKNSSSIKRITVKGNRKTSLTLNKCVPGTNYKIQVRSYKKINGKTYYSAWSKYRDCYMQ